MARSPTTILALETSCDDSAVAVLRGDAPSPVLLASLVASQADLHRPHGGVVPEIASRNHVQRLPPLVRRALHEAGVPMAGLSAFAATRGPGLASSLLVGHSMAKALAVAARKPFLSVNHMEGHLLSPFLGHPPAGTPAPEHPIPPHLALIVSGGHTLLVRVTAVRDYEVIGRTIDDAAGEAFDKVARLLGLPYPGGPEIERLARDGDPSAYPFPRSMPGTLDFSFSGLKTAVRYTLPGLPDLAAETPSLCASFQQAVIDVLIAKTLRAAQHTGARLVTLSGGVSRNRALRDSLHDACNRAGLRLLSCRPELSTDNAAMIAFAAWHHLQRQILGSLSEDIDPNLPLTPAL